jgi:DNA-binding cell septation regulator SpoVG
MLGFLSIELPSGLIINDAKLMVGPNGRLWIALPSERQVDGDGNRRLDANGKQIWSPVVDFRDRAARDRFQDQVLAALRRQHPDALEIPEP